MPLLIALLVLVALTVAAPADACACGVALDASVSRERALVVDRGATEDIVVSLDLTADAGGQAAVVFPVPADPQVGAVEGGDPLDYLDEATAPKVTETGGGEGAAAGAPPGGVDVIGRGEVGGYDVSRLRADDPAALSDWLTTNGYTLPDGAEPILQGYVDQHWRYVAIRLQPGAEGTLKPLRIGFASGGRLVYPMRLQQLAAEPANLTLYVLGNGEATVAGHGYTPYAGTVDRLDPQPPAGLRNLFDEGSYITRITIDGDSAQYTTDLAITTTAAATREDGSDGGPPWWVWALGGVAVLGAVVVANRKFIQN